METTTANKFQEAEQALIKAVKQRHPYGNELSERDIRNLELFDYAVRSMVEFAKPEPMPKLNKYVQDKVFQALDELARRIMEDGDLIISKLQGETLEQILSQLKSDLQNK